MPTETPSSTTIESINDLLSHPFKSSDILLDLPRSTLQLTGALLRKLLLKLARARTETDAIRAASDTFMFPASILRRPTRQEPGSRSQHGIAAAIARRIRRAMTGVEMPNLWKEALVAVTADRERAADRRRATPSPSPQALRRHSHQRARALFCRGEVRRALASLNRSPLVDPASAEVEACMRSLHPEPQAPFPNPPRQTLPEPVELVPEDIDAALLRMDRNSAPGPDLMHIAHPSTVLREDQTSLPGESGMEILGLLANRFVRGDFPDAVMQLFSSATLVAIPKAGSQGFRPIAVGNAIRRLISIAILNRIKADAAAVLAPLQTCVGVPSGADLVAHEARHVIESNGAKEIAVLQIDAKNAFNSVHRHLLLERCAHATPGICRYVAALLRHPPTLRAADPRSGRPAFFVPSAEGVQQGDPLAMLLFALILQPIITEIATTGVKLNLWYADDGNIIGSPHEIARALCILEKAKENIGFEVNFTKTTIYTNSQLPSDHPLRQWNCPIEQLYTGNDGTDPRGISMLGAPIGNSEFVLRNLSSKISDIKLLLAQLHDMRQPQLSFLALRLSLNASRVTHILRTTPPEQTAQAIHLFDMTMREGFQSIHGEVDDRAWLQAKLPLREQGCGIPDYAAIHGCAYFASVSDTAIARSALPARCDPQDAVDKAKVYASAHLASYGIHNFPEECNNLPHHSLGNKTQMTLCRTVDSQRSKLFWPVVPSADEVTRIPHSTLVRLAHRRSIAATGGSAFLSALPTKSSLASPQNWPIQVRLYLRERVIPDNTRCGHCGTVMDTLGHHALAGCSSGLSRYHRHDAVVTAFCQYVLRPARLSPTREIPGLVDGTDNRPADLFLRSTQCFHPDFPESTEHALDISIRDVTGSSQISKIRAAIRHKHGAPGIIENDKVQEFRRKLRIAPASSNPPNFAFSPVGFDLNGAWGPRALQILEHCSTLSSNISAEPKNIIARRAIQQVSQVVSQCNAALVRSRLIRSAPFHSEVSIPT